ncbi:hypothetical protein ACJ41O_006232 [Fusarium nematophilum]
MGVVAVAGGSGDVGRTIVDQLLLADKHTVVILSRKLPATLQDNGPVFLAVNYSEVEETAKALEGKKVDTVISALSSDGPGHQAELDLIAAADKSSTTQRFIPSEFAGFMPPRSAIFPLQGLSPSTFLLTNSSGTSEMEMITALMGGAIEALKKTGLKFTRFANGMFMDYFGQPNIPTHLRPFVWAIDIGSRRAVVPGTGNGVLSLTYSKDVALFIDRLLDETEWPEFSIVSGDDITFNEIVAIAERITGDKFNVAYDSLDMLKEGKATLVSEDDASYGGIDPVAMAATMGVMAAGGQLELPKEGRLNDRFPDIRPMSVEELVTKAWSQN